uniref:uncharacterized protein n=1 Tax=Semicossyphus pulcher TaxID=241346 RepID=UPI0037E7145B
MTVSMSAVCLKLLTIFYLCSTALTGSGSNGVVRKDFKGSITIQCRFTEGDPDNLTVKKGLSEDQVLYREKDSEKNTITAEFRSRLQVYGKFPNLDILIKNLSSEDTGPYWCTYETFNKKTKQPEIKIGTGSVLLVVADADTEKKCEDSNKSLVLVSVVITAVVLLTIIVTFCIWILKTKNLRTTAKPRRVANNDVYEDMRGTIRR